QWGNAMRKAIFAALAVGGTLVPGLALADAREDVVSNLTRCAQLTEDRQWLDCYYGAAQPMRAWLGLSPASQGQLKLLQEQPKPALLPSTVTRAAVRTGPPPKPKASGLFDVFGGSDVVNNQPVASYDVKADGFFITLADGQVWKQTDDDASKHPVRWRDPASSMRVTISQGAMHSFNLVVNDENLHHKVKRIR
ncbi:MAG: hypothetical protein NTX21_04500, partial [Alphaproteobacteria bacterium]|nr:hypothetical protein [Alphaproteobacteria bacterium]